MQQSPKINVPALYSKINSDVIDVKACKFGYKYSDINGNIGYSTTSYKIYRYAKNYYIDDNGYSLIMITSDGNIKTVEKYLDEVANTVTSSQAISIANSNGDFKYLNKVYKGIK